MPYGPDTRSGAPHAGRVLATAALIVRSPIFWAPVVVAVLVHAAAGPEAEPWLLTVILTPVTVGAAVLVRALLRRHPYLGQLALLALTLLLAYLLLIMATAPRSLFSDSARSVSNAPGP